MAFKIIYRSLTVLLLIALVFGMFTNYLQERTAGRYTGATSLMSNASKEWIIDTFGENESFEELLDDMTVFVCENFVYDVNYMHNEPVQWFDFGRFKNDNWRGVCFDFSNWAKVVVLEWSSFKNVGVQCYIVDVNPKTVGESGHSYNYFIYNDDTFYVDYTALLREYNRGKAYNMYAKNIGKTSMYDYSANQYSDVIAKIY